MRMWKSICFAIATMAAGVVVCGNAWSQTGTGVAGFWTVNTGGISHDYAFTKDGKYESKVYGTPVYQVNYGTYSVQGDQLTLTAPRAASETYRWKIVSEYGRATLKLTDSFGATYPYYSDRFDHRSAAGTPIPYEKASIASFWIVNHGRMRWEYAFTSDGRFQSKRMGDAINETVRGTYVVKGPILILSVPNKPLQPLLWRLELENGAHTLILVDSYGAFEVYYESKAGT